MNIDNLAMRFSISGARAHSPEVLDNRLAYALVRAWCDQLPDGPVVIARDTRPSGIDLKRAVIQALVDAEREILDADIIPLPTTILAVHRFMAAGAIDITASHNPPEYNGLKFITHEGEYLPMDAVTFVKENTSKYYQEAGVGYTESQNILDVHEEALLYHLERVRPIVQEGKPVTVAVDAVNGAGSELIPRFLEEIGCTVIPIATEPNGDFPHMPEPKPENLEWTQQQLEGKEFDFCAVLDPDADRLVLIDECGVLISEEYPLPLVAKDLAARGSKGAVIVNMSSSLATEKVLQGTGMKVSYCPVGEPNVVSMMKKTDAIFGGEGNGGVIDPRVHYGRDALTGIAHTINMLRRTNQPLSELVADLPQYEMYKNKLPIKGIALKDVYAKLRAAYPDAKVEDSDGLRFSWPGKEAWIHVRPSNTEPIVRIHGEAKTAEYMSAIVEKLDFLLAHAV